MSNFEYPMKVTVTFDDMVGMECPLCQGEVNKEELLDRIEDCRRSVESHVRITKEDARQWLNNLSKDIEEGKI